MLIILNHYSIFANKTTSPNNDKKKEVSVLSQEINGQVNSLQIYLKDKW